MSREHHTIASLCGQVNALRAHCGGLKDAMALAAEAHPEHPESTVVIRVWSDGTLDLEQYATYGADLNEWGMRMQKLRGTSDSVPISELPRGVEQLRATEWYDCAHQAPQDARAEIEYLRGRITQARRHRDELMDLLREVIQQGTPGITADAWEQLSRIEREVENG